MLTLLSLRLTNTSCFGSAAHASCWRGFSGLRCFSLQSAHICTAEKTYQGVDMHTWVPTCHMLYGQSPRQMHTSQGFWRWRTGSAVRQRHIARFSTQWAQRCRILNRLLLPEIRIFFDVFQIFPQTTRLF